MSDANADDAREPVPGEVAYGVLLPHFGSFGGGRRVVEAAVQADELGFDSVWVRDHLVFRPHGSEDPSRSFLELGVTLGAVAAATRNVTLATGTMIPFRHPIHAARVIGSVGSFAGPGRLLVGLGVGGKDLEFDLVGMRGWDRREVAAEYVDILRRSWTGESFSYSGKFYAFDDLEVLPAPEPSPPIWYAGSSAAAVRRAVEYCDGWIPGRMPNRVFRSRLRRMTRLAGEVGVAVPRTGTIPYVVPMDGRVDTGLFNVEAILAEAARRYTRPDGSALQSLEDIDGAVIVGTAEEITDGVRRCHAAGAQHVVFDLRLVGEDFEVALDVLGRRVLPSLREDATEVLR